MELTDDMLKRIADNLADLRLRVSLLEQIVAQHHPESEEFEDIVKQATETPDFQQFRTQILEQLKERH